MLHPLNLGHEPLTYFHNRRSYRLTNVAGKNVSEDQPFCRVVSLYTGHSVPQLLQWNPTMVAVPGIGR